MSRANPRFHRNNAPLPAIATCAFRVQVFYQIDQQICLWGIDFIGDSAAISANAELNIGTTFRAGLRLPLLNLLASDCFLTSFKVTCLTSPSRIPRIVLSNTPADTGAVSGPHLNSELAIVISKDTATKGQHGRGRSYLPGIPTSFVTPATDANRINSVPTSALLTLIGDLFTAPITDGPNNFKPALTTTPPSGQPTTKGQLLFNMETDQLLGVIRRRRVGKGK